MARVTLSTNELNRYDILQRLLRGHINATEAAAITGLSVRQVKRLKVRVALFGAEGLCHGHTGKPGHHRLTDKERQRIIRIIREHYPDFGPTFATEKLWEQYDIDHDPKTIRQLMIGEGLWKPRQKKPEEHRSWRQRRSHVGEMLQFDGSYEYWFEDRADKCCLLLAVDDATSAIIHARFAQHEGVFPVFMFWQEYVEKHGKPMSIYLDKFSTYKMNQKVAVNNHDLKTQFARAMSELGIEVIFAHSPQAKGRVENKFGTLQDRLVKELRLANISTRERANQFLDYEFIHDFNERFAVEPRDRHDFHRPLTDKEQRLLPSIFSKQTERTVQNDFTISFNTQWYQLTSEQPVTVCKQDMITVEERTDNTTHFRLRGKYLNAKPIPKRPSHTRTTPWVIPGKRPMGDISISR